MSTEKRYTEREMVLAQRRAYLDGVEERLPERTVVLAPDERAKRRYPLPKVTRPRVVSDPMGCLVQWSIQDDQVQHRHGEGEPWKRGIGPWSASTQRIRAWADLLAHPTEEVEAEE